MSRLSPIQKSVTAKAPASETSSYLVSVANALINHTASDPAFDQWLRTNIDLATNDPALLPTETVPYSKPLTVRPAYVTRKAWWLFDQIRLNHDDSDQAAECLFNFARIREREDPKAIVLGLEIGVLPIGIMGKMKTRREPMDIIFSNPGAKRASTARLSAIAEVSHRVMERGLMRARGNTHLLEPELSDWFFGDKTFRFWRGGKNAHTALLAELKHSDAPHASLEIEPGRWVIALSPALSIELLECAGLFEPLS